MTKTMTLSAAESAAFENSAGFRKVIIRTADAEAEAGFKKYGATYNVEVASVRGLVLHTVTAS